MAIAIISDIHVCNPEDDAYKLLLDFLRNKKVEECNDIFLLGDIFDLMAGYHPQYLELFNQFFKLLKKLTERGINVHYFDGNHDLHLGLLFKNFKKRYQVNSRFFYYNQHLITEIAGKKYYISHGDDIELGNPGYKRYKEVVTNNFFKFFANYIMPYKVLELVGRKASADSKKRNKHKYNEDDKKKLIKENFRKASEICNKQYGPFDFIICGHSHAKDNYQSKNDFTYLNNGYAQSSKTFIYITDEGKFGFELVT
jgi:UDP-2,3-diacylglucosamine hydrolase